MDIIVAPAIFDNENPRLLFDLNVSLKENDVEEYIIDNNIIEQ
jgi:hypothetical protein